jgi:Flp pilus assembly protein TadD
VAAVRYSTQLTEAYPEFVDGWVYLGEAHVAAGRMADAESVFREAVERHPNELALSYRLGLSLLAADKVQESEEVLVAAITGAGDKVPPSFAVALAVISARKGEPERSILFLRQAISGGYDDREVLVTEPMLAPMRAVPGFREIVDRIPARTKPKSAPAASQ